MIFNKKFDKSLWCILEGDSEKRGEIISFLKKVPDRVFKDLKSEIAKAEQEENKGNKYSWGEEFTHEDGTVYVLEVNFDTYDENEVEITNCLAEPTEKNVSFFDCGCSFDVVYETPYYEVEDGEEVRIGNFVSYVCTVDNGKNNTTNSLMWLPYLDVDKGKVKRKGHMKEMDTEYYLVKNEDDYSLIRFSCVNGKRDVFPIDINQMPEELTMGYIEKRYGESPKVNQLTQPKGN